MIETDNETYRVEYFYPGEPFKYEEFGNKDVLENTIKLICDFNYDTKLLEIERGALKINEFIGDHQNEWYWKLHNEVHPLFEEIKNRLDNTTEIFKTSFGTINEIKKVFFGEPDRFYHEF